MATALYEPKVHLSVPHDQGNANGCALRAASAPYRALGRHANKSCTAAQTASVGISGQQEGLRGLKRRE